MVSRVMLNALAQSFGLEERLMCRLWPGTGWMLRREI